MAAGAALKLLVLPALLGLTEKREAPGCFSGRITYRTEFQDEAGEPLFYAVPPETRFYVGGGSYKWYDRQQQLQELYQGSTGHLYRMAQGRAVADTSARPAPPAAQCLPATATILGYRCEALRLVQGEAVTLVFYAPALRLDPAAFSHCAAPGWYALLQATGGALPLRTVSVDTGHSLTVVKEAIAVQPQSLTEADFTLEAPAR